MTISRELLPCPFCGEDNLIDRGIGDEDGGYYEIMCSKCNGGSGRFVGVHSDNREDAIAAWNTRAALRAAAELDHRTSGEQKLVYVKRWRTIVSLPAKYADEIREALARPAPEQAAQGDVAETAADRGTP